jgi:hypothetical protein
MLNQVILVGRVEDINLESNLIMLKISQRGTEDSYVNCIYPDSMYDTVNEYIYLEQVLGIKGRLETIENETIVKIDKISMLTSGGN